MSTETAVGIVPYCTIQYKCIEPWPREDNIKKTTLKLHTYWKTADQLNNETSSGPTFGPSLQSCLEAVKILSCSVIVIQL